jgi:hypothetical protein
VGSCLPRELAARRGVSYQPSEDGIGRYVRREMPGKGSGAFAHRGRPLTHSLPPGDLA